MARPISLFRSGLVVLLAAVVVARCYGDVAEEWSFGEEKKRLVEALFDEWNNDTSPGAAIGIAKRGTTLFSRGHGIAHLDYSVPIRTDSLFYIASTSKQFTAAGIAMLANQGVIRLDADIRTWLKELPFSEPPITVRHLLHHTSGIRDYGTLMALQGRNFNQYFDNSDTIALLARQRGRNFAPGSQYRYCNSNYVLLAEILKRSSEMTLQEFSQKHFFGPLKMTRTQWVTNPRLIMPSRVASYVRTEGNAGLLRLDVNFGGQGDGNLWTSIQDILKWDANFYEPIIGGDEFVRLLQMPGELKDGTQLDYGFGLSLGIHKGCKTISHGGQLFGYSAELLRFPERGLSVAVLANISSIDASDMARAIADIVLNLPESIEPTNDNFSELKEGDTTAYIGEFYEANVGRVLTVSFHGGKLVLSGMGSPIHLIHKQENNFESTDAGVEVGFVVIDGIAEDIVLRLPNAVERLSAKRLRRTVPFTTELSGLYRSDELDIDWRLRWGDGRLTVSVADQKFELSPLDGTHFESSFFDIELHTDQDRICGFTVSSDGASGVNFTRVAR